MQAHLLRFLESGEIQPVGQEGGAVKVDVRVIAATNRDLESLVVTGAFRTDLLYRVKVLHIHVPPLRDRKEDLPFLIDYAAARAGRPVEFTPGALEALARYRWPGNVRELQNVIERAVIVSEREELAIDPAWLVPTSPAETARTWAEQEKARILTALQAAGGRVYGPGGAAQRLGLKPTTLYGKMRKHGLKRDADWQ
jgi:formate hydrogenlyase transcriptional activator